MVKALEQANQPPPPEEADAVYHEVYTNDGVDVTIVKTSPQDSSKGSKGKGPKKPRPSASGPPPPPPPMMHGALAGGSGGMPPPPPQTRAAPGDPDPSDSSSSEDDRRKRRKEEKRGRRKAKKEESSDEDEDQNPSAKFLKSLAISMARSGKRSAEHAWIFQNKDHQEVGLWILSCEDYFSRNIHQWELPKDRIIYALS